MRKIGLFGAGQFGSRHLQALAAVREPLEIVVVDSSAEALAAARQRYESVAGGARHSVRYAAPSERAVGAFLDVAIVATRSDSRLQVLRELCASSRVGTVILEKVLFSRVGDYDAAERILDEVRANAWVNCCMRQVPVYRLIRDQVGGHPFQLLVTGSRYGLVTNAIHYFDYMAFLTGSPRFEVGTEGLAPVAIASRRSGFAELNGTLTARFANGSHGLVTCFADGDLPMVVEVHSATHRFIVRESEAKAWVSTAASGWAWSEIDGRIPYQSELTTETVEAILAAGTCQLTPFRESRLIHASLFEPLREFLRRNPPAAGLVTAEGEYPFT